MKRTVITLMLATMLLGGCGGNKEKAFYVSTAKLSSTLAQSFGEIAVDCKADPNTCPFSDDQWRAIKAAQEQLMETLPQWNEALKNGEDYWSPMTGAITAIDLLKKFMAGKEN